MSQTQRLRPGRPNPLRYQGGLRHYHVSPMKAPVPWEQWIGGKRRLHASAWLGAFGFCLALGAIVAALCR